MTDIRPALGYANRVDGIDVSEFQPLVNYAAVAAAGFRFAMVRVSLGSGYRDPRADTHLEGFRDASMYAIPYAAARPIDGNPEAQADRLWDAMGGTFAGRMVLDLETRGTLTGAQVVDFAERFAERCETFALTEPVLYSYPNFLTTLGASLRSSRLARMPLWLAAFPYEPWIPPPTFVPVAPPPWIRPTLHQYSGDRGYRVPGVAGPCDRDLFLGTECELRAWLGLPSSSVPPVA